MSLQFSFFRYKFSSGILGIIVVFSVSANWLRDDYWGVLFPYKVNSHTWFSLLENCWGVPFIAPFFWVRFLRRANFLSIQCPIFERLSWGLTYTPLSMSDFRASVLRRTDCPPYIFLYLPLQYQPFERFSWGAGFLLGLLLYQIRLLRGFWPEDSTIRRSSCETFLLTIFWNLHTPFYLVVLYLLNLCFVIVFGIFLCRFLYELYLFCILG